MAAARRPFNPIQAETGMSFKGPVPQDSVDIEQPGGGAGYVGGASGGIPGYNTPARGAAAYPSIEALNPTVQAPGYAGGRPGSAANISQPGYDQQQQTQLEHDLRMQEFDAKRSAMEQLIGRVSGGSTGPRVSRVEGASPAAEAAARDAAFARAKEKAGQNARASMAALQGASEESGLMGSSVQAQKQGAILGGAGREINDVIREQAIQEADAATQRANLEFGGQITQRGQELGRAQQMQQAIMSLIGGLY